MENKNTSQVRSAQPRMPSARLVIILDISTAYARARSLDRVNIAQSPQDDDNYYIDENGSQATKSTEDKYL